MSFIDRKIQQKKKEKKSLQNLLEIFQELAMDVVLESLKCIRIILMERKN